MPLHRGWSEIAFRLLLTVAAGVAIGLNREATGHAAGLRTTLLVCLAASVAMIQTNPLLPALARRQDVFRPQASSRRGLPLQLAVQLRSGQHDGQRQPYPGHEANHGPQ